MTTEQPNITAYLKPVCGWSAGVRAVMDKYSLDYADKESIKEAANC